MTYEELNLIYQSGYTSYINVHVHYDWAIYLHTVHMYLTLLHVGLHVITVLPLTTVYIVSEVLWMYMYCTVLNVHVHVHLSTMLSMYREFTHYYD